MRISQAVRMLQAVVQCTGQAPALMEGRFLQVQHQAHQAGVPLCACRQLKQQQCGMQLMILHIGLCKL